MEYAWSMRGLCGEYMRGVCVDLVWIMHGLGWIMEGFCVDDVCIMLRLF